MESLVPLLIIIGLSVLSSSMKKKKAAQKQKQNPAAPPAQPVPKQTQVPYTRDEWQKYLQQMGKNAPAKPAPPVQPAPAPAKPAPKYAPVTVHDDPEGSVSTQGETHAEHAVHQQRMKEAEDQLRREQETLQELRSMNLKKLRTAVVMSEVLGKPVSLRRRDLRQ